VGDAGIETAPPCWANGPTWTTHTVAGGPDPYACPRHLGRAAPARVSTHPWERCFQPVPRRYRFEVSTHLWERCFQPVPRRYRFEVSTHLWERCFQPVPTRYRFEVSTHALGATPLTGTKEVPVRGFDKHLLAPVTLNKAEAFCHVEPFHRRSIPSSPSAPILRARERGAVRGL
jgi:hypothetical protein